MHTFIVNALPCQSREWHTPSHFKQRFKHTQWPHKSTNGTVGMLSVVGARLCCVFTGAVLRGNNCCEVVWDVERNEADDSTRVGDECVCSKRDDVKTNNVRGKDTGVSRTSM